MKRLTIIVLSALLIFAVGGNLAAFDFGGSLVSGTNFTPTNITAAPAAANILSPDAIANEEALGLWLETGKGEHYSFEMKLDMIARFSQNDGFSFFLNPDYLKLDSLYDDLEYGPSILATSLGRFTTSDFSTKVFSQKLDGLIMNFNYPAAELTIAAGTTALMFSETGDILTTTPSTVISKTDVNHKAESVSLFDYMANPDPAKSVFDNPKAIEIVTLTLPQLIAKQSLTFSLVAQEDLRPMMEVINGYSGKTNQFPLIQEGETLFYADRGGAVDTQYIGAGVSGPSIGSLYHNIYYYFGTGRALTYAADPFSPTGSSYQYDMIVSHMAGISLDYFMSWLFDSRASAGVSFGTGDADAQGFYEGNRADKYTQFTPITGGGGGLIFSPGVSNILSGNISYSIKPFGWLPIPFISNMQIAASILPFMRVTEGPIAVSGISPDYTGNYLGSEIDLTVNMRPFSDLGIMLQTGYFLPDADAFAGSAMADPAFTAKLNVSLSF